MLKDEDKNEVPDIFAGFITETSVDGEVTDTHGEHNARKDPDWPQFTNTSDDDEGDDEDLDEEDDEDGSDDDEELADDDDGSEDDDGDDSELDADADDDDDAGKDKGKKRRKKSARQRIAELTAEKHARSDRIAELEAENEALKTKDTPPADDADADDAAPAEADLSDLTQPDPSKYEFGEIDAKYMQDIAEYNAEVAFRKREAKAEQTRKKTAQQEADAAAYAQMEKNFLDNVLTPGLEEFDDFEAIVIEGGKAGKYQLSPTLVSLISESDQGAKIMYHFASNPKEASKVASQSVSKQAAYFGRLEARFDTSPSDDGEDAGKRGRAKATKAPKPGKRKARGSGKGKGTNPATTDFASFENMVRSKG
jgi:hypothetical protein